MSGSAYRQLFALENVREGVRQFVKDVGSKTAIGIDGVSLSDLKRDTSLFSANLHRSLHQGYEFSALKPIPIPKANGKGYRVICVPSLCDRIVQRMLVGHLMSLPSADRIRNPASFGFMKSKEGDRRGVQAARDRAIQLRNAYPWAYKSDVSNFFDNICRDDVVNRTVRLFRRPSLAHIIKKSAHCEVATSDHATNRIVDDLKLRRGHGVRQGMPISPLLSNVILESFDRKMIERGFHLVRYADDFIVLCKDEAECHRADREARALLAEEEFTIPQLDTSGKTQIVEPNDPIEFLGLAMERSSRGDYDLKITQNQIAHIKDQLGYFRDFGRMARDRVTWARAIQGIEHRASGYRTAYAVASNLSELIQTLDAAVQQSTRRLFVGAFGEPAVSGLRKEVAMVHGIQEFPPIKLKSRPE